MGEIIQRNMEGRTILFEVEHGYLSRSQNSKNDREPQNTLCLLLSFEPLKFNNTDNNKITVETIPYFLKFYPR